ncbi:MAG: DUF4335 domain-containing protein [Leptolyngbyaceae cyanobacterium bins.302]|nr:DUF4335 domain-containing protein [Leptolyngbyaceae cyanobacterium bins.302]
MSLLSTSCVMARSHSVLRRYTPPTCTLEVIAKDSALSRWVGKPVVNELRFQLSLDDPKLEREEWVVVQGDRTQLAALSEAVSNYVQNFLGIPHEQVSLVLVEPDAAIATLPVTSRPMMASSADSPMGITLHPKGLLSHELHWGELATEESGAVTQLSTLQLFDLANALDDYSADVLDLPQRERQGWVRPFPNWAQVAAVVLVAVGLSTSAIRLLEGGNVATMAPMTSQGASSNDQKIATQLPPAVVEKATPPVVSNQPLPPPPVGSTPSPQPGMPTVTTPKQASPSPASGTVSPDTIAAYPVPVVPNTPTVITGESAAAPSKTTAKSPPPPASQYPNDAFSAAPNAAIASRRGVADEANQAGATAFDTIPQVAEVRNYFQQKWKPPEGLNQILEYSLQLNADGTIENIAPLRQASGDYIDRTGMPLLGDPFVSPLKGRQSAKVRLVLEPNGQVRAFLEE